MAAYYQQVLVSTGHSGWPSRIEDDESTPFTRELKTLVGRRGKYSNVVSQKTKTMNLTFSARAGSHVATGKNVMITHSDFPPEPNIGPNKTSVYLFPSFQYFPEIPSTTDDVAAFTGSAIPGEEQPTSKHFPSRPVTELIILICGHGSRDSRCGIIAPPLRDEFHEYLNRNGILTHPFQDPPSSTSTTPTTKATARIGLISHIGGHKFAGNIIIYIPPGFGSQRLLGDESGVPSSGLEGKGIWYGRVEPRHVEGIVRETILGGRVIRDFFRGGVERVDVDGGMDGVEGGRRRIFRL
ncbi:MAG: hypothetical protein M1834_003854 [Cirrosporium novae-zelandiae]|nr:MAG: hypothetical protein M1834_003854 [Cirrosporium novae-zelandiae]